MRGGKYSIFEGGTRVPFATRWVVNAILLKHTGHPLEKIEQDTDRDRFMSAQEALDYRLIDEVIERLGGSPR